MKNSLSIIAVVDGVTISKTINDDVPIDYSQGVTLLNEVFEAQTPNQGPIVLPISSETEE